MNMSDQERANRLIIIANERTKLLANALDRASISCLTVGVVGPIVPVLYDIGGAGRAVPIGLLLVGSSFWLFTAAALHMVARWILGRLE